MALAALADIRQGFVDALKLKLGASDQQIVGYITRNPVLPTIWVRLKPDVPIIYHQAMGPEGGIQSWSFLVEAYCGDASDVNAQMKLDEFVESGPKCVAEAVLADPTLGGIVQDLKVTQCNAYVEFVRADGTPAIGANWQVEVYP